MSESEEDKKLLEAFKSLNVKQKVDSPQDLQKWLEDYGRVKEEKTVTVSSHQPRLSIFYGDTDSLVKGDATYEQWKYEIKSLIHDKTYKIEAVLQAIRRSVIGEASRILMRLGPTADISAILDKFESVYGVVDTKECLLAKFYSARQSPEEDVTTWSCRLEDILNRGLVRKQDTNEMLKSMFWTGLRHELKDVSGYKF